MAGILFLLAAWDSIIRNGWSLNSCVLFNFAVGNFANLQMHPVQKFPECSNHMTS
jgi:hypothetical protein